MESILEYTRHLKNTIRYCNPKSSSLGPDWWLGQPLVYRDNRDPRNANAVPQDTDLWPPALKSNMIKIAIEVLHDEKSDRSILAQACMIMAHGAELRPEQRVRALAAVNQHLVAVCANEQTMAEPVTVNAEFDSLMLPNLLPSGQRQLRFSYSRRDSQRLAALSGYRTAGPGRWT
jgi:hypothetical protein